MNKEEILKILRLVYDKKVSPEQAYDLISEYLDVSVSPKQSNDKKKKIKIVVTNKTTGKNEANIRIPIKLAKFGTKFINNSNLLKNGEKLDIDFDEIIKVLEESDEPFVEVDTDSEKVLIELV